MRTWKRRGQSTNHRPLIHRGQKNEADLVKVPVKRQPALENHSEWEPEPGSVNSQEEGESSELC